VPLPAWGLPVLNKKTVEYAVLAAMAAELRRFARTRSLHAHLFFIPTCPKGYIFRSSISLAEKGSEIKTPAGPKRMASLGSPWRMDAGKRLHGWLSPTPPTRLRSTSTAAAFR